MKTLSEQRVLITAADAYMGPAIARRFEAEGAHIVTDTGAYEKDPDEPRRIVEAAGRIDILVVNLPGRTAVPFKMGSRAERQPESEWQRIFNLIVHPTMRFVTAALPQMIERRRGKIIAVTSAAPLRGVPGMSAYSAARAAQNAYVRATGVEVAPHNVQINAIAQSYTVGGFPPDAMDNPKTRETVLREVPAQRLATGEEQSALALFLASQESNYFSGQVFPFTGGWATT